MTVLEELASWRALLPPVTARIPAKLKMLPLVYEAMMTQVVVKSINFHSRFDAIPVFIDEELEVAWILYDQHGEEMSRA